MTFKVTLQPSGRSFEVARDERVLAAAIRAGIGLPYSCRDGACGSCKSRLIEGRVIHGAHQTKALSPAEEDAGWLLTCCATPQTDLVIEARHVNPMGEFPVHKMPCRVRKLLRPAPDIAIVHLQLPTSTLLQYHAGQYVEFLLPDDARRSYSIATPPHRAAEGIELHIRRMAGGVFTEHVFSAMKERDILRLEGPYGGFWLREDSDKPIALLASGTGIAPIKAIVEHLRHKVSTRPVVLYWGCRSRADLYLHDWALAQAAASASPTLTYVPVLSEARPEDAWHGRTGFVHEALMADLPDLSRHQVYACGAPVMVDAAQRDLVARCGLPEDEFYADAFTSEADKHGA